MVCVELRVYVKLQTLSLLYLNFDLRMGYQGVHMAQKRMNVGSLI